ncbi:unnamed protein product [Knipowitschia caucasica]|uniref:Ras-associating domain-containing protein n=1 Tax=Knipowitschia caucasica TaxID=637954 RepID=A0AAV2L3D8_KNICA
MAPFGKSFLKARIKQRSKEAEPTEGKEIQVTVCGDEKSVCGVTKRTTCLDMIQALLDDHKSIPEAKRQLHGDPKDFCLVERWKGFERAIPPLTHILRLWLAWGEQRPFVRFVLVKTSDFVAAPVKKCAKPKGARPKRHEQTRAPQSLPAEKQKRVVRKAFRKLEKLHKENKSSSEDVDKMVQLILQQDHAIREQIQRMQDLDSELERMTHLQDGFEGWTSDVDEQVNRLVYTSDGIEQLETQVQMHQLLILELSREIDKELRKENQQEAAEDEGVHAAELERLQSEISRSLFAGVSLQNQVSQMDSQLQKLESTLVLKDDECWQLASQLNQLQIADRGEEKAFFLEAVKGKGELRLCELTDTDSDTGISSTHSQDSLSPGLDFPPPLDSDV